MYKHILVPTDGSELSSAAVEQALQLAKALGAKVSVMTVAEPLHILPITPDKVINVRAEYEEQVRQEGLRILGSAEDRAVTAGVSAATVQVTAGDAWQAIIDTATERGCDLIAMASHGRRGIGAFLMGSVTTKVLSHSTIPVLVYRS
ncbi:universal stress protein [Shinella sp.]|uniref:universal stress protein n=1 Tax=Shinella sp. TaxID=1870904 RepID=UPI0040353A62